METKDRVNIIKCQFTESRELNSSTDNDKSSRMKLEIQEIVNLFICLFNGYHILLGIDKS